MDPMIIHVQNEVARAHSRIDVLSHPNSNSYADRWYVDTLHSMDLKVQQRLTEQMQGLLEALDNVLIETVALKEKLSNIEDILMKDDSEVGGKILDVLNG